MPNIDYKWNLNHDMQINLTERGWRHYLKHLADKARAVGQEPKDFIGYDLRLPAWEIIDIFGGQGGLDSPNPFFSCHVTISAPSNLADTRKCTHFSEAQAKELDELRVLNTAWHFLSQNIQAARTSDASRRVAAEKLNNLLDRHGQRVQLMPKGWDFEAVLPRSFVLSLSESWYGPHANLIRPSMEIPLGIVDQALQFRNSKRGNAK